MFYQWQCSAINKTKNETTKNGVIISTKISARFSSYPPPPPPLPNVLLEKIVASEHKPIHALNVYTDFFVVH